MDSNDINSSSGAVGSSRAEKRKAAKRSKQRRNRQLLYSNPSPNPQTETEGDLPHSASAVPPSLESSANAANKDEVPLTDPGGTEYRPEINTESNEIPLPDGEISRQEWVQREMEYERQYQQRRAPLGHHARAGGRGRRRIDLPHQSYQHAALPSDSADSIPRETNPNSGMIPMLGQLPQLAEGANLSDKLKELLFSGRAGPKNQALQRQLMKSERQSTIGPSADSQQQQQQQQLCAAYLKTGACKLGVQCPFLHKPPVMSRGVLLRGLWAGAASLGKPLIGDDALEADIDETERFNELISLHVDISNEIRAIGRSLRSVKILSNEAPHLSGLVFAFFGSESDAAQVVVALNGRYYGGRKVIAELSPVSDWNLAQCTSLPDCLKGASCAFPHFYDTPDASLGPDASQFGANPAELQSSALLLPPPQQPSAFSSTMSASAAPVSLPWPPATERSASERAPVSASGGVGVEYIYTPKYLRGIPKNSTQSSVALLNGASVIQSDSAGRSLSREGRPSSPSPSSSDRDLDERSSKKHSDRDRRGHGRDDYPSRRSRKRSRSRSRSRGRSRSRNRPKRRKSRSRSSSRSRSRG